MATYNKITQLPQVDTATPADSETASKLPASTRQVKDFLKTFLAKAHNDDGTLKDVAVSLSAQLEDQVVRGTTANSAGTAQEIAQGTVSTPDLRDSAVTVAKLATDAVETVKIKDANVTAAKLAANAVTPTAIAANAVETAKILDLNVTTGKLADLAVTTAKLNDLSVSTGKIIGNAVTLAKLESVTSGYVLAGTGAGVAAASVAGVLTATYAAGVLTFAFANTTAAAGSLKYVRLDEKANSGVDCGASAAATWVQNRGDLTGWAEVDAAELLTLTGGGKFSLKAGTYSVRAFAPGNAVGLHQLRLRKITATATTVLEGGVVNSPVGTQGMAVLQGVFTVAADADEYALQHWTTAAIAVDGLGQSATTGEKSVFASIEMLRIA